MSGLWLGSIGRRADLPRSSTRALVAAGPLRRPEQLDAAPVRAHLTGRPASELPLDKLKVPAGFKVEVWADGVPEARSLALGDKGTVFVSNRNLKNVYAVVDQDGKREVKTLLKGLNAPNGVAFSKGTLYVAERDRITRYDGIEEQARQPARGQGGDRQPRSRASSPATSGSSSRWAPTASSTSTSARRGNIVMPSYMQASIIARRSRRPA